MNVTEKQVEMMHIEECDTNNTLENRDVTGQQAHDAEHNGDPQRSRTSAVMSSAILLHWQLPALLNDAGAVCQVLGTGIYVSNWDLRWTK